MKKFSIWILVFISGIGLISSCLGFNGQNSENINFYSPEKGIYVVDIDTTKCSDCIIQPYVSDSLETVETIAKKTNAKVAINAGFFDPYNAKTTSYIVSNRKLTADPSLNEHFINNPHHREYLPAFLNRSEFRYSFCEAAFAPRYTRFDISPRNETDSKCEIINSIQAGPELVPELRLEQEAFVVKKNGKIIKESAGALHKFARSAIGIKGDHILLIAVSKEAPMTLSELAIFMKSLGVEQAMAFDGGSSTSLYVNLPDKKPFVLTSAKDNAARRIKSALLVK